LEILVVTVNVVASNGFFYCKTIRIGTVTEDLFSLLVAATTMNAPGRGFSALKIRITPGDIGNADLPLK
jgi:hypothetical protein